ncbi:MAG TPA: hypothetical protein VM581_01150 [Magnetospirillaceae bacterium]|nr:hypothetical protein [Magnetospirillaceae bacterium]
MLGHLLQPNGSGVYVALGLMAVSGIAGAIVLWTPDAVRPTLRAWPSRFAFVHITMAWTVATLAVTQLFVPELVPLSAVASFTEGTANVSWLVAFLAAGMGFVLFWKQEWSMLGMRNFLVAATFGLSVGYTARVLDDRAFGYYMELVGLSDPAGFTVDVKVYVQCLVVIVALAAFALGLTVYILRRSRKIMERYLERYVSQPALDVCLVDSDTQPDPEMLTRYHKQQLRNSNGTGRYEAARTRTARHRRRTQWWEWFQPLAVLLPFFPYFPPRDEPRHEDKSTND